MAIPIDGVIEGAYVGECLGQTIMSVFHWKVGVVSSIPNTLAELDAFASRWQTLGANSFLTNYLALMPLNYTLTRVTAQQIWTTRSRRVQKVNLITGNGVSTATTANVQSSITFTTDFAGRTDIGGKRLLLPNQAYEDGKVNLAHHNSMIDFAVNCVTPLVVADGGGTYLPVIYHRVGLPTKSSLITGYVIQDTVRVMRRRTVGLGI